LTGAAVLAPHDGGRAHRLRKPWWVVSVLGALGGAYALWTHVASDPLADVHSYYAAAARLNAGLNADLPYPPLFAILFRPLALLPFGIAAAIWEGLIIAAFGLTLWRLGIRRPTTWYAVGILGMAIGWTLAIGQAEAIITLLLTIGSPLAVATAGHIKLFPLLAGLFWLGRRDWRRLKRFIGWTIALGLFQLLVDPVDTLAYPGTPISYLPSTASFGNISPFVLSPLLWAALVVIGFAVTLRLGRTRWGWSAAVALSVLASPRLFVYMLMTLLACLRPTVWSCSGSSSRASTSAGTTR
jgi:Glycosyltransferase family 87